MSSWDQSYNSDALNYDYLESINPLWAKFVLTHAGFALPRIKHGGYACQLGFGQGVSINIHALTSQTEWYGNDSNPTQASYAQETADLGSAPNVHLYADSFKQFAQRDDLPQFDYICIHGIWSRICGEDQQYIVDFINKHLKLGGILYISYNISPNFMLIEPVRYLAKRVNSRLLAKSLKDDERIHTLEEFVTALFKQSPAFLAANLGATQQTIDQIQNNDINYLVNEYLKDNCDTIHINDVVKCLAQADVQFACSENEPLDKASLETAQQDFLNTCLDSSQLLYEEARDFMLNNDCRHDFFIKGARKLTPMQHQKQLRSLYFILYQNFEDKPFDYKLKYRDAAIELPQSYSKPIFEYCSDRKVHSYGEILDNFVGKEFEGNTITAEQVLDVLYKLTTLGVFMPACAPEELKAEVVMRAQQFNRELLLDNIDNPNSYLANPVCQKGTKINNSSSAMLCEYLQNPEITKVQLANNLLARITNSNNEEDMQKIKQQEKSVKELTVDKVNQFFEKELPYLKAMYII